MSSYHCSRCGEPLEEIGIPPQIQFIEQYQERIDIGVEEVPEEIKKDPYLYRGFFCYSCNQAFCPNCSNRQGDACPECGGNRFVPAYRPLLERSQPPSLSAGEVDKAVPDKMSTPHSEADTCSGDFEKIAQVTKAARALWLDFVRAEADRLGLANANKDDRDLLLDEIAGPAYVRLVDHASRLWNAQFSERGTPERLILAGADLSEGVFLTWDLNHADLRDAKLDYTHWLLTDLTNADLSNASLRHSVWVGVFCPGAIFRNADLSPADVSIATGSGNQDPVDFTGANFVGAQIVLISGRIILTDARMDECSITIKSFSESRREATLHPTQLQEELLYGKSILDFALSGMTDEQCRKVTWHVSDSLWAAMSRDQRSKMGSKIIKRPGLKAFTANANAGNCFIATAVCGSPHAQDVLRLREFRDTVLRKSSLGRDFIHVYESFSPLPAHLIRRFAFLRFLARSLIVRPARQMAERALNKSRLR